MSSIHALAPPRSSFPLLAPLYGSSLFPECRDEYGADETDDERSEDRGEKPIYDKPQLKFGRNKAREEQHRAIDHQRK